MLKRINNKERTNLKIYYNNERDFPAKLLSILSTFLVLPQTSLLPAQDYPCIHKDMDNKYNWIVEDWQDKRYFKWDAIIYAIGLSPLCGFLKPILKTKPLMNFGKKIYNTIADNRTSIKRLTASLQPHPLAVNPSKLLNAVALSLLILMTLWNIRSFANHPAFLNRTSVMDRVVRRIGNSQILQQFDWMSRLTRLDQSWSIFAPNPPRDDGWHVIVGKFPDGSEIDLLNKQTVSWNKPSIEQRNSLYRNMQWRTYFINLNRAIGKKLYPYYGEYLCRQWNSDLLGQQKLASLTIFFMKERTVPQGEPQNIEKTTHWQQSCIEKPLEERGKNFGSEL
jgi:hypothetical protein